MVSILGKGFLSQGRGVPDILVDGIEEPCGPVIPPVIIMGLISHALSSYEDLRRQRSNHTSES